MKAPAVFGSLRGYRKTWLRRDVLAGLTVWAVLVPESLAYATIAGVPPVTGLYAAPAALILYAAFGSSRHLVVGPMSATAALSAGTVAALAGGDAGRFVALTAALALVAGVVALLAGLARMGFLAGFISEPVLKGFIIGLALTIIAGQLPKLFGVERTDGNFFEKVWGVIAELGGTNPATLAVGAASLVALILLKRFLPLLPSSLIVVLLGVLASVLLHLPDHGVAVVGRIDSGLPPIGLPAVTARDYLSLVAGAIGIVLVGFAEGLGAAKTYATRAGYEIDANRELIGLGAANVGSGLMSGMVVNGSLSKTAVNGTAGARSQISGLTAAALTVLTLLLLTGLFEQLPEATLGAVVIVAVGELVDFAALRRLYGLWTNRLGSIYGVAARADFLAAIAAMLGVLVFDTLPGLFIGIAVSMLLLLYRASRPNVAELGRPVESPARSGAWVDLSRHPDAVPVPGVVVVRVESALIFANADNVRTRIRAIVARRLPVAVVLDAETVPFIDVTAAQMLVDLGRDLARDGVRLKLARDVGQVRDVLRRAGIPELAEHVHPTVEEAVAAAHPDP